MGHPRSWSVLVCAALAVLALGAESPEPRLDCSALVPDDVVVALGWAPGDPAEEDARRCLRRVDHSGAVTVSRPQSLRAACDQLREAGGEVAEPVDWLEPTRDESCVSGPDVGTGVAELVFVDDTDEVVQVRIEARRAVTAEQLRAAFGAVADAARADVDG